jgi:hypothetical protein
MTAMDEHRRGSEPVTDEAEEAGGGLGYVIAKYFAFINMRRVAGIYRNI